MSAQRPTLRAENITKRFPGVVALKDVSLDIHPGQVHALVGENGAGKSTLIKVMTGVYKADGGKVVLGGTEVEYSHPAQSQAAGVSTIYQEVNLIPMRSVAENVFLGREYRTRFGLLDRKRMEREAEELLGRLGIEIDVSRTLRTYGIGTQQMVAIARALSQDARVVIMDEPTSSLQAREVETLYRVVRQLKADGVAVIYVSHRLDELYDLCDEVTVLRDGEVVHSGPLDELPRLRLIAAMLGRELPDVEQHTTAFGEHADHGGALVLDVQGLASGTALKDVSLQVHAGEIVGLGGLLGSGRTETAKAIFGALPVDGGHIEVNGQRVDGRRGPAAAVKAGLAYLSEDRKAEGIIPDLSVRENLVAAILPRLSRAGLVNEGEITRIAERFVDLLGIKISSLDQPVRELSGGNQQKVLLARWLCTEPSLLILDEPTRGIDVGAKAEVQKAINELASSGMAVLLISSEVDELVEGSDRAVVLRDGRSIGMLAGEELTEHGIVRLIAGEQAATAGEEHA